MAEPNGEKVALVTGASSGIGKASARLLAEAGFRTFGTSRSADADGPDAVTMLQLDVTDDASVDACVSEVLTQAGRVDVLVNNAGFGIFAAGEETSLDEAHAIFEVNVFGALRMSRAVLPGMRERGSGRIINIASGAGIVGVPFEALYCATKFALRGMTESMRIELKPFGVHVCTVDPGFTKTNFEAAGRLPDEPIDVYDEGREGFLEAVKEHFESGLAPEDVGRAVVHAATTGRPATHDAVGSDTIQAELGRRFAPKGLLEKILTSRFGQ
jgi:NAD(P)-dependent dehydrogenase (short-subunit alcohol dehydrogenase family)